ncbi:hypothetical protein NC239_04680 [Streptomyces sp. G3]|uniref:hypothetical protein n=1 Tax=unclassified Streptomyces TaxID=2593676 RepID=UPI0013CC3573|nr:MULTISPECIES: hypothetical protein [unclassified Streptomyces]MCM1937505.1 hypothetical protein [Streptomyces sp. G3]NDZ72770.1 hypothetical protein [Streptomyces sp. SID10362]QUW89482.1 hypothetical protein KE639_00658 [Streptomyces sp. V17-9]
MVSVTPKARNIEITAEGLQEDLARLEIQKQALERELAAVTAHLGSVQRALSALQALMPESVPSAAAARPADVVAEVPATTAPTPAPAPTPDEVKDGAEDGDHADDGTGDADGSKSYGKLTEQILAYFAEAGNKDVRARDVASALGRDTDSGSINAVRSTLDRLVGQSRVRRVGRGLYRAAKR